MQVRNKTRPKPLIFITRPFLLRHLSGKDLARFSQRKTVHALIIEDDFLISMAIESVLRDCGFTSFDVAVSEQEAIAAVARKCPCLITADVELQPGCGIEAVQSICSERPIPVVFITGSPEQVRTRMPGHLMIQKPFGTDHVTAAVKLALERRESGRS
ncbi:MAG: response regulator [Allosphingosinicella sp.]